MQKKYKQNIYEKMSYERIKVISAQIDILNYYDSENKEKRFQELYNVSHQALIAQQSERSIEKVDALIVKFKGKIIRFRKVYPNVEEAEEVRKKLSELERLSSTFSSI